MTQTSTTSRIARYLTTIAVCCCLYGAAVWLGRAGEPDQGYVVVAYAVAAASMLGCWAYLGGVPLGQYARAGVDAGRSAASSTTATLRPVARRAAPAVVALLVVTSTFGGLALVGTQPLSDEQSGAVAADSKVVQTSSEFATQSDSEYSLNNTTKAGYQGLVGFNGQSFTFANNGSMLYFVKSGFGGPHKLRQYSLSEPYDVSTATYQTNKSITGQADDVDFAESGKKMYISDGASDGVTEYELSVSYNISSAAETEYLDINTPDSVDGVDMLDGGKVMIVTTTDQEFNRFVKYELSTPYNLSTATRTDEVDVGGGISPFEFMNGGTYLAAGSGFPAKVELYQMDDPYNISAMAKIGNYTDIIDIERLNGLDFDEGGGSMYVSNNTGIHTYDVGDSFGATGKPDLNGTVSTQTDDGVANATVQLTISKEPSVTQADAQLDELSNAIPNAFEQQIQNGFDLLGDGGFLSDRDGEYAAIYSTADLGLTYQEQADLSSPKITNVEPGEQQAIILGDTTADCGLFGLNTNEYNQQIAGCVQPEGNVTIEKLSGTSEVVATDTVSVEEAGNYRDFGGTTNLHYAPYTFTEGVYRISPEDDGISYLVKAGDPTPDFNRFAETIENTRTEQAQNLRNAIDQDLLEVRTITTNETGHWNASIPDNAKLVTVSARKAPGVDVDPSNLTYENMTDAYNAETAPNASVYLPSRTKRVTPPAQNVDVTLTEVAFPSFADLDKYQTRLQELRNKLNNLTMDDLPPQLLQRMETESREDLATAWSSLRGTLVNFGLAREAYLEVSDRDSVPTADELSKSELQAAIQNANVAITRSSSTGELTETASETTEDAISQTWELAGIPLEEANVSVLVDYSNGTTRVVDDEYIQTDSGVVGADTISVEEFPLGEDDPEQVSFRLRVAGSDEFAAATSSALNPTFSGEPPAIDAVEFTSLRPGPNDRVTVEVHPDDQSTFDEVTEMTVRGPDGESLDTSNVSDGTTASFTTNGQGVHSVRLTVESTNGGTFTDVVQLEAAESDETMRPSIYAHSGPLGTYALVGDGFESGDVETTSTGSLEIVGVLGTEQDVPNTVDVFTEGIDVGSESTSTIRIVRGESRQSVRANIPVVVHTPMLNTPDDARSYKTLVRSNGQPITWDGSTRFGAVQMGDDGASIKAYTDDSGVLTLSLDNSPSFWERTNFSLDTNYPWLPLMGTVGSSPLLAGLFVLTRRRSDS